MQAETGECYISSNKRDIHYAIIRQNKSDLCKYKNTLIYQEPLATIMQHHNWYENFQMLLQNPQFINTISYPETAEFFHYLCMHQTHLMDCNISAEEIS